MLIACISLAHDARGCSLDRAPAEVLGPRHAQAAEIDRPAARRHARGVERESQRIAIVLADLRREQQAGVGDRAAHRARAPRSASSRAAGARPRTMPGEGRKPTTPQCAAGMRSEPPVSEPVQTGSMSVASATAEPPDEPPALSSGLNGLPVAPHTGLRVLAPAPNSGTLVLPTTMAPAARTPRHHDVVARRHEVAIERRAVGGEQALGLLQVLDAGRQPVQQPERLAAPRRASRPPWPRGVRARTRWRRWR